MTWEGSDFTTRQHNAVTGTVSTATTATTATAASAATGTVATATRSLKCQLDGTSHHRTAALIIVRHWQALFDQATNLGEKSDILRLELLYKVLHCA